MSTDTGGAVCIVCDEATEEHTEAICNGCGKPYHLNQRADRPGKDCGEVWINEDFQALEFACNICLHPEDQVNNLEDIIDLPEAADAAGLSEATLIVAVEQGTLRGKRMSGGTWIFQRRDVVEFAARQA